MPVDFHIHWHDVLCYSFGKLAHWQGLLSPGGEVCSVSKDGLFAHLRICSWYWYVWA